MGSQCFHLYYEISVHSSCDIVGDFVEHHVGNLCVILRSSVILSVYVVVKDIGMRFPVEPKKYCSVRACMIEGVTLISLLEKCTFLGSFLVSTLWYEGDAQPSATARRLQTT